MRAIPILFIAGLLIISCDSVQYYYSVANEDMNTCNMNPAEEQRDLNLDLTVTNPYKLRLLGADWLETDYHGRTVYYVYSTMPGDFYYPADCKSSPPMSIEYIPNEKQYTSLFTLRPDNSNLQKIPNTALGKWKFRINGFYKTRNFISVQSTEFSYWIDSMEVYAKNQSSHILLGTIQGTDWQQEDPLKMDSIAFEHPIPTGMTVESIDIRFFRRCVKSAHFDFNKLSPIPPSVTNDQPSRFKIESIEFVQIP